MLLSALTPASAALASHAALGQTLALPTAYTPSTTAIANNVVLTALLGLLPLVTFFVLMGVFKVKTHWCAIIALVVAALVAVVGFGMPIGLVGLSATQGAMMGLIPICYIVVAAVWLYNLTETSGRSADLKAIFNTIGKGDQRVQALIVAFSFCGLLEGLAGFGAPVAISGAMLLALGVKPLKAAAAVVVGNSVNVGFGAMAIPVTTAARLGGVDDVELATNMGHISWIICLLLPFLVVFLLDGLRGVRQLWPVTLVAGLGTAMGHFFTPSISYALTAVVGSLLSLAFSYLFLLMWTPKTPEEYRTSVDEASKPDGQRIGLALLPYVLVVVIIAVTKLWGIGINLAETFSATDVAIRWPGLHGEILTATGEVSSSPIYTLQTLSNPGTWIILTALIVSFVYAKNSSGGLYETTLREMFMVLPRTIYTLRWSLLTIVTVMALAYVMNFSGQTTAIGAALAATGAAFAFLSPFLGWLGTGVAGSATSAGALFANLQATAAEGAGIDPRILLAANTVGAGFGKIISPQNLAVIAGAVEAPGSDADILKKVMPFSLGLVTLLGVLVLLASLGVFGPLMVS